MSIITTILATLVALEFFYIFYLETLATDSNATGRVFNMDQEERQRPSVNTLFKNQGVYNGLLGILLLYGTYLSSAPLEFVRVILVYIILVAAYGAMTSDKKIILTQGGLAILALISSFFL
jgi:putative membrane protein